MMPLLKVATTADIPEGEARRFRLPPADPSDDPRHVAVANLGHGDFRAVDAVCSHQHAWLDEGEVDPDFETIECPKHGSTFDLETGKARALPATQPVRVYALKVEGDDILIEVNGE